MIESYCDDLSWAIDAKKISFIAKAGKGLKRENILEKNHIRKERIAQLVVFLRMT